MTSMRPGPDGRRGSAWWWSCGVVLGVPRGGAGGGGRGDGRTTEISGPVALVRAARSSTEGTALFFDGSCCRHGDHSRGRGFVRTTFVEITRGRTGRIAGMGDQVTGGPGRSWPPAR